MYAYSSNDFIAKLNSSCRTFKADICENGVSIKPVIRTLKYTGGSNSQNFVTLGSAICASVEATLSKPGIWMMNKEYSVKIGMDVNGTDEYVPLGLFTAEKPVEDENGEVTVTMYDRMKKFELPYFSRLSYPASTNSVIAELCQVAGVPYNTPSVSRTIATKPDGYTCREMIVYVAQILGTFAIIDRTGKLTFKWYSPCTAELRSDRYWSPFSKSENNYLLRKITAVIGKKDNEEGQSVDDTIIGGSGTKGIMFENPFYTQDIMNAVWRVIGGQTWRPASVRALGDPRIDPGDIVTVYDLQGTAYSVPVMDLSFDYDGGLAMEITAVGDEEQKDDFSVKGPTTQAMERMAVQLLTAEKLIANKIDADVVEANYIKARDLDANVINSDVINAHFAQIDLANVNNAFIEFGQLKTAIIDTAHIKAAAITTACIADEAVIDSKIVTVSANKLTAGTIDAGQIDVVNLNAANITVGKINGVQIAGGTLTRENMGSSFLDQVDSKVEEYVEYYISWDSDSEENAPTASAEGWDTVVPQREDGKYIWKMTETVYGNGSHVLGLPVCLSGTDGAAGEDATLLRIDSSRGNMFKNNEVSTVLSVTIYRGPDRITNISDLRSTFGSGSYLQWYYQLMDSNVWGQISQSDTRLSNNGFSFTITPADVDTKVNFRCDLMI